MEGLQKSIEVGSVHMMLCPSCKNADVRCYKVNHFQEEVYLRCTRCGEEEQIPFEEDVTAGLVDGHLEEDVVTEMEGLQKSIEAGSVHMMLCPSCKNDDVRCYKVNHYQKEVYLRCTRCGEEEQIPFEEDVTAVDALATCSDEDSASFFENETLRTTGKILLSVATAGLKIGLPLSNDHRLWTSSQITGEELTRRTTFNILEATSDLAKDVMEATECKTALSISMHDARVRALADLFSQVAGKVIGPTLDNERADQ